MAAVLAIESLVKRYEDRSGGRSGLVALDGVSLEIPQGEIFALLGPNGAGKTTLIGAVCGLVRKTSGTIRVFGLDLDVEPVRPRFEVGLVPQEINFDPFFTARETLEIQLGYFGRRVDRARVAEVLAALSLTEKADAPTRALSGGMKRRLLIAKALVHRPRLVFLDEPTAGVDVELRRDLWAYVRRLRDEGTTVVLTTHYLEEAEALADRVGIIDHGKLLVVEDKAALMKRLGVRRVEVRFQRPVSALPPGVPGELDRQGLGLVFLEHPGGTPSAAEVIRALFAAELPVADVNMVPPRLEDVLLRVLRGERELARPGGAP